MAAGGSAAAAAPAPNSPSAGSTTSDVLPSAIRAVNHASQAVATIRTADVAYIPAGEKIVPLRISVLVGPPLWSGSV